MKGNSWIAAATLLLVAWLASPAVAENTATVKRDRVNVRGQPTIFGEVITQLRKDETVVILEEIKLAKPKAAEPAEWAKIQMPANTPVWVNATYIDPANKTVTARRLNLRAGPGENFSVVGLLTKDAEVKEIRVVDDWMEIEAPTNAYAFVAREFLEKQAPAEPAPPPSVAPKTEPVPEAKPAPPAPPPAPTEKPAEPAPTPAPKEQPPAASSAAPPTPAPDTAKAAEKELILAQEQKAAETQPVPAVKEETPLITEAAPAPAPAAKRIVRREGIVKSILSLQAPTQFELVSAETGKAINYLHPKTAELKLKTFKGRRVVVSGEELIDPRWPKTPVLAVETIELTP
jgi:hypothetical protein